MFDIGFSELLVVAVVALVVLGPERLPKAARFAGLWVRRARAQWYSVKSELERELAADELKRSMQDTQAAMREIETGARQADAAFRQARDEREAAVRREFDTVRTASSGSGPPSAMTSGEDRAMPGSSPVSETDQVGDAGPGMDAGNAVAADDDDARPG